MTPARRAWLGAAVLAVIAAVVLFRRPPGSAVTAVAEAQGREISYPPLPRRVTVQLLNGTRVPRLVASVGMPRLRRAGLDVVISGDATDAQRAAGATLVLVRRGDTTGVGRLLELYPEAIVQEEPKASLLVDLTVVLGPDAVPAGAK